MIKAFTLNTGQVVPAIGFGTWDIVPDTKAKQVVLAALEAGYRLIDTARMYGNERGIGAAIRESGIPRHEIFIVTKVWNDEQGYDRTMRSCSRSLEALGLDYIDAYLIHWPATMRRSESWHAFERLYEAGTIKAAGVSNYTIEHLEELKLQSPLVPAINQIEFHPYIYEQQEEIVSYCQQRGIVVQAYSPLNRSQHRPNQAIKNIAKRHNKTPQQIFLKWAIEHGTLPLPRSSSSAHMHSNIDIFDFELSDKDNRALDSISDGDRVTWDPTGMGFHAIA